MYLYTAHNAQTKTVLQLKPDLNNRKWLAIVLIITYYTILTLSAIPPTKAPNNSNIFIIRYINQVDTQIKHEYNSATVHIPDLPTFGAPKTERVISPVSLDMFKICS